MKALNEQQWRTKAHRQAKWKIAFGAELEGLGEEMERLDDLYAAGQYDARSLHDSYKRIHERAAVIEKRLAQLERIMARHLERYPPHLRLDLNNAMRVAEADEHVGSSGRLQ